MAQNHDYWYKHYHKSENGGIESGYAYNTMSASNMHSQSVHANSEQRQKKKKRKQRELEEGEIVEDFHDEHEQQNQNQNDNQQKDDNDRRKKPKLLPKNQRKKLKAERKEQKRKERINSSSKKQKKSIPNTSNEETTPTNPPSLSKKERKRLLLDLGQAESRSNTHVIFDSAAFSESAPSQDYQVPDESTNDLLASSDTKVFPERSKKEKRKRSREQEQELMTSNANTNSDLSANSESFAVFPEPPESVSAMRKRAQDAVYALEKKFKTYETKEIKKITSDDSETPKRHHKESKKSKRKSKDHNQQEKITSSIDDDHNDETTRPIDRPSSSPSPVRQRTHQSNDNISSPGFAKRPKNIDTKFPSNIVKTDISPRPIPPPMQPTPTTNTTITKEASNNEPSFAEVDPDKSADISTLSHLPLKEILKIIKPRYVLIDGANVGRWRGSGEVFDSNETAATPTSTTTAPLGTEVKSNSNPPRFDGWQVAAAVLAIEQDYNVRAIAVLPEQYIRFHSRYFVIGMEWLDFLKTKNRLHLLPAGVSDDNALIDLAKDNNTFIVTNDRMRDHIVAKHIDQSWVETRLIQFYTIQYSTSPLLAPSSPSSPSDIDAHKATDIDWDIVAKRGKVYLVPPTSLRYNKPPSNQELSFPPVSDSSIMNSSSIPPSFTSPTAPAYQPYPMPTYPQSMYFPYQHTSPSIPQQMPHMPSAHPSMPQHSGYLNYPQPSFPPYGFTSASNVFPPHQMSFPQQPQYPHSVNRPSFPEPPQHSTFPQPQYFPPPNQHPNPNLSIPHPARFPPVSPRFPNPPSISQPQFTSQSGPAIFPISPSHTFPPANSTKPSSFSQCNPQYHSKHTARKRRNDHDNDAKDSDGSSVISVESESERRQSRFPSSSSEDSPSVAFSPSFGASAPRI